MSTDFGSVKGTQTDNGEADMSITRYYGGVDNGVCVQLTMGSKYIGLTENEAFNLINIITEAFEKFTFSDRLDEIESRLSALERPAPEQKRGEWIQSIESIWIARKVFGEWIVERASHFNLIAGDYWMPYDPEHPEKPEPPKESVK